MHRYDQKQKLRALASIPQTAAASLSASLAAAEDAVARLDERLATSPIATAFRARTDVVDAAAAIFCEGELVSLEDLVLHDAAADARAPTIVITRAHAVLRARRRLAAAPPGYALSAPGFDVLRGAAVAGPPIAEPVPDPIAVEDDLFAAELADIDALLARTTNIIAGQARPQEDCQDASQDVPEDARRAARSSAPKDAAPFHETRIDGFERRDRLAAWRDVLDSTRHDPPVLAAARAVAAFDDLAPLPNMSWLGRLAAADLLRARKKTRHHLAALALGQKLVRRDAVRRRPHDAASHLAAAIAAITYAAKTGLADHDRFLSMRQQLRQNLAGRRATSRLPELIELVLRAPVVSTGTIAAELKISTRAAQDLVAALKLRELSGRARYRCWGLF